ncbi:MAG TPA: DNA polymerase ligase N-terminal domain-containing protein [Candidatus Babeliales bacterium]|jgi:DNA ligase D-like protein (predicted 3'-phosphoesterase)|nr:DNA polymerase ligase N-terminal domain-containing protein [Candidatus Babeliales bacterium]
MIKKMIALIALLIGLGFMLIPYDSLLMYKKKRNFDVSPEPQGNTMKAKHSSHKTSKGKPIFVIQKHNASHLHYDFRLEIDGVLKSWAIPKGPSTDPHDKRLAMETEDHPMDYARFEGIIPEGEYGAGAVIVWDTGTFENIKEKDGKPISLAQSYKNGQIEVNLHGKKLQGGYALIRTSGDDMKKWLCIKMRDEYADARRNPVSSQPESVISGKTIEEVEAKKKLKK